MWLNRKKSYAHFSRCNSICIQHFHLNSTIYKTAVFSKYISDLIFSEQNSLRELNFIGLCVFCCFCHCGSFCCCSKSFDYDWNYFMMFTDFFFKILFSGWTILKKCRVKERKFKNNEFLYLLTVIIFLYRFQCLKSF